MRGSVLRGFLESIGEFFRDVVRSLGFERAEPERPPAPPPEPERVELPPPPAAPAEEAAPGTWRSDEGVRFAEPGHLWTDASGELRPLIEYRGSFMTREEAEKYVISVDASRYVLVVVEFDDHFEVWLDYVEGVTE